MEKEHALKFLKMLKESSKVEKQELNEDINALIATRAILDIALLPLDILYLYLVGYIASKNLIASFLHKDGIIKIANEQKIPLSKLQPTRQNYYCLKITKDMTKKYKKRKSPKFKELEKLLIKETNGDWKKFIKEITASRLRKKIVVSTWLWGLLQFLWRKEKAEKFFGEREKYRKLDPIQFINFVTQLDKFKSKKTKQNIISLIISKIIEKYKILPLKGTESYNAISKLDKKLANKISDQLKKDVISVLKTYKFKIKQEIENSTVS